MGKRFTSTGQVRVATQTNIKITIAFLTRLLPHFDFVTACMLDLVLNKNHRLGSPISFPSCDTLRKHLEPLFSRVR